MKQREFKQRVIEQQMNLKVTHDPGNIRYRSLFGAVPCGQEVQLAIYIEPKVAVDRVLLRLWDDKKGERKIEALPSGKEDGFWISTIVTEYPVICWYYFIIETRGNVFYYSRKEDTNFRGGVLAPYPMHSFQITVFEKNFKVPAWYRECVMYQIFPDRFHRVSDYNPAVHDDQYYKVTIGRRTYLLHKNPEDTPSYRLDPLTGKLSNDDYFGGNLRGIIEKLDYLQELGISALYLNPIFEATSNHRYNTGDYKKIDPLLGDLEQFKELCSEAKKRGISIILDGVFSHTGSDSIYFNKDGRYPSSGAYQSKDSKYFPWYRFNHFPDDYDCWWGVKTLPNVNETEPSYMDYIIRDEDSVVKYWIENGAMGWRLDVADELPDSFIQELRFAVKSKNQDAVLIGEVWEDASNKISYGTLRQYLLGNELDSTMNYPFRDRVLMFLTGKISGKEFILSSMTLYQNYPKQSFFACMNLLGTHDVPRLRTILGDAPLDDHLGYREQSEYRLNEAQKELADKRQRAAVVIQMTFPGVPVVYYGDEAGMEGCADPFNRGMYPWGKEDKSMIEWYKKWIKLRNETDALRKGEYIPLTDLNMDNCNHDAILGYIRLIKNNTDVFGEYAVNGFVLVLVNRDTHKESTLRIDLSSYPINNLRCVMDQPIDFWLDRSVLTVTLPATGFAVWTDLPQ